MAIDFEGLKRRIEAADAALDGALDPAAEERLLRDRARALAERRLDAVARTVVSRVVVVRSGTSLLGLPVESVREVREVRVTRLPHAKPPVQALFQLRGRVLALVDLDAAAGGSELGEAPLVHGDRALIALLTGAGGAFGLRIAEVIGARDVFADEVERGLSEGRAEAVSLVTRDLVQIVDIGRLSASVEDGGAPVGTS